jgi:16S rRNA (adenine1518-N6/adenine1519-N6)-dimethyltransferase
VSGLVAEVPQSHRARAASRDGARIDSGGSDEPSATPVQPSLRRLKQFSVRPDRELGQNFLIDSNILGVIDRAAELTDEDVVLEVGGGLGVLTEYLADRVRHVHVIEIDRRLKDALTDAIEPFENVTVHWADVMTVDLAGLRPEPTKVVANLPYGVAAGALLRTIEELGSVNSWVAMAQREVGERLAAGPVGGGRAGISQGGLAGADKGAYGVPSVIAQLACEVEVLRAIPRTVFYPVPNVDSVLVGLRRRSRAGRSADSAAYDGLASSERTKDSLTPSPALRALVNGAFAHRRKTLVGSLALSGRGGDHSRQEVREALEGLGHPADVRAERLSPEDFRALARLLEL